MDNPPAFGFAGPSVNPIPVKVEPTGQNSRPKRHRPVLVPDFYGPNDLSHSSSSDSLTFSDLEDSVQQPPIAEDVDQILPMEIESLPHVIYLMDRPDNVLMDEIDTYGTGFVEGGSKAEDECMVVNDAQNVDVCVGEGVEGDVGQNLEGETEVEGHNQTNLNEDTQPVPAQGEPSYAPMEIRSPQALPRSTHESPLENIDAVMPALKKN